MCTIAALFDVFQRDDVLIREREVRMVYIR
jgi:hypothetical protein